MNKSKKYLGIDIGSVAVSLAVLDENNTITQSTYAFHQGKIRECLSDLLIHVNLQEINAIGCTSSAGKIVRKAIITDSRVAYISAARMLHSGFEALLIIGAEKFGLVTFNDKGDYLNYRSNSSCAAGTGSFLDQQAERLNLESIQKFSELANTNKGNLPLIASRCAVFAKTDLIHAQTEGYSLEEICDGLSYGLAKNIVDTVFAGKSFSSVIASGGVAFNKAVIKHLEQLTGVRIQVDEYAQIYGAIGAAIQSRFTKPPEDSLFTLADIIFSGSTKIKSYYPPLELRLSNYPDFSTLFNYEFRSVYFPFMTAVEVDIYYQPETNSFSEVYLGIDIGSTSTKAILADHQKKVIAGLYTRTSGQPLFASQMILEAIRDIEIRYNIHFQIIGFGTTGSGRKFTGKILSADLIIDEITAHARAACELNPDTDTIIEIGGQDSKFTVIDKGVVTFSVMNNVCAAGTGSFIEEQAKRLGCSLSDFSSRAMNSRAPLISDRCTVFMERDINHYLAEDYPIDEILASVLHSIRDNYLTKVAQKGHIGNTIFFQGATAKNKALVAAFEQKLGKPIMVSKYCHLTGALGVTLELHDQLQEKTRFRGLDLYRKNIPVTSETCTLCTNSCKLKVATINNETEAYGFLCGRDYHQQQYIRNQAVPFQLTDKRREIFHFKPETRNNGFTIGIPAGLHLFEEILFWRTFFDLLSIKTISSENYLKAVRDGKNLSGAEFCSPIAAIHGHVNYLMTQADYIFLPVYLEETQEKKFNRQYCYYTQFASSIITTQKHFSPREKILSPVLKSPQLDNFLLLEIYRMLKSLGHKDTGWLQITLAYEKAKKRQQSAIKNWQEIYEKYKAANDDIHVILLGRPYTVLSPALNHHIPELIEKQGIRAFFMDMLPLQHFEITQSEELLKAIRWRFASKILYASEIVAKTENCYPVLITSFKCTPDAFVIEYFKEILNSQNKPYLILQLDEHDSAAGYETRIEAGIRAFRNHRNKLRPKAPANPRVDHDGSIQVSSGRQLLYNSRDEYLQNLIHEATTTIKDFGIDFTKFSNRLLHSRIQETDLSGSFITSHAKIKDKTLLLPSWDSRVGPLLEAVLQNSGIDARLVSSTTESIQRSLSYNTGQCLPLNIIVENAIEFIESNSLDPSRTLLWLVKSNLSCNFSMFPHYSKKLLNAYGQGLEKTNIYLGDVVFSDLSIQTAINAYLAYMFGGYIRKIECKIRPYEKIKGSTDIIVKNSQSILYDSFKQGKPKNEVLAKIIRDFQNIETILSYRPKVAIFGDLYVRDNDLMNQNLIRTIEDNGGEVITTPYSEYIKIVADTIVERRFREGKYLDYAKARFLNSLIPIVEDKFIGLFYDILGKPEKVDNHGLDDWLNKFGLNILHSGESLENILKIYALIQQHPDIELFIQTNPSYCCPSLVTEAMTSRIEEITGIPVVTIEYDGTSALKNEDIVPYLHLRRANKG
ncbi:MAG: acyl-CoA dehydratase activase [Bacteroidales bacterium]